MSDIAKGVGNLFAAVFDIIKGIFTTILNVISGAINAAVGLVKNVFNMAEGVVGFIIGKFRTSTFLQGGLGLTCLGNIFIIGTLCAVYFGYQLYQQRQGRNPAPISRVATKKTN